MQSFELRPIPGLVGYLASSDGEIFSTKYLRRRTPEPAHGAPPRRKAKYLSTNGYYYVSICIDNSQSRDAVHRLVATAFHGKKPFPRAQVRHLNGDRTDNRQDNLEWGTRKENADDMVRHGRSTAGEANPSCVLRTEEVALIKAALSEGIAWSFLARRFFVTVGAIQAISRGVTWRTVSADANGLNSILLDYSRYPKRNSGEKNGACKLSEADVTDIRRSCAAGERISWVAKRYGVTFSAIKSIVTGRTWRRLLAD